MWIAGGKFNWLSEWLVELSLYELASHGYNKQHPSIIIATICLPSTAGVRQDTIPAHIAWRQRIYPGQWLVYGQRHTLFILMYMANLKTQIDLNMQDLDKQGHNLIYHVVHFPKLSISQNFFQGIRVWLTCRFSHVWGNNTPDQRLHRHQPEPTSVFFNRYNRLCF